MTQNSKIEWTNDTWNPWQGCRKVSAGCKYCYMYRDKKRYGQDPMTVVKSKPPTFNAPLIKLKGPLVFTCSWSDWFIEDADPWRDEAWDIIRKTPHLTYQILTKRPENILSRLPDDWGTGWHNVWLGVSVENQEQADKRIPLLSDVMVPTRFLSCEPLLGPVDIGSWGIFIIDWVISGGESGTGDNWRKAETKWFLSLRDQCQASNVPFFHKQHGGNKRIDGAWGGRLLDGREWNEMPNIEILDDVSMGRVEPVQQGLSW